MPIVRPTGLGYTVGANLRIRTRMCTQKRQALAGRDNRDTRLQ
jgi:hypothetical protein